MFVLKKSLVVVYLILINFILGFASYQPEVTIYKYDNSPRISEEELAEECKRSVASNVEFRGDKLHYNKTAIEIADKECLLVLDSSMVDDFDGDGYREIAMITSGAGCGSCHVQELRIIKDDKIIFYKDGIDFTIKKAKNFVGFLIEQPILKDNEGACCPSEGILENYELSKESPETFVKISEQRVTY